MGYGVVLFLGILGVVVGFVDSIAGGGGLITLPALSLVLGAGPEAIGTNKICGFAAAAVAFAVYARRGHFVWRKSVAFAITVGIGAVAGTKLLCSSHDGSFHGFWSSHVQSSCTFILQPLPDAKRQSRPHDANV